MSAAGLPGCPRPSRRSQSVNTSESAAPMLIRDSTASIPTSGGNGRVASGSSSSRAIHDVERARRCDRDEVLVRMEGSMQDSPGEVSR
eukprot:scaffold33950_cov29-Tisochrysis_lutea.AAC.5